MSFPKTQEDLVTLVWSYTNTHFKPLSWHGAAVFFSEERVGQQKREKENLKKKTPQLDLDQDTSNPAHLNQTAMDWS